MTLKDDIPELTSHIEANQLKLRHNHKLFSIYEGELLKFIEEDLRGQFTAQSFAQIQHRIAPINILKRIIDKLSRIYQHGVSRRVVDGVDKDSELLVWYEEQFKVNENMNIANEFFNLFKHDLVEPYLHKGVPRLRAIPADRYLPFSNDPVDPTTPTHILTVMGTEQMGADTNVIYHAYTDEEFAIFDSKKKLRRDLMAQLGNEEGTNPFGKIPFVYTNSSKNLLIPKIDTDTLKMTKLVPILISDLNYAVMYQSFSIIFGIDVDDQNIEMSPNAFWKFKSDPTSENKPEIGSIKPQVDIAQTLELIKAELSFWLNSRGIRPGAAGQLSPENFASGISKMVDEMDTSEARTKQVDYFEGAEQELWDLVFNHMHPYWVKNGLIENNALFTPTARVETNFSEQLPMQFRGDLVRDLRDEVESGFTSKKRAVKLLNPDMTDSDVDGLLLEVDAEGFVGMPGVIDAEVTGEGSVATDVSGAVAAELGDNVAPVQSSAFELLNGAQVSSLVNVLNQVATGIIPKASAKGIIRAAFGLDNSLIDVIVDPIVPKAIEEVAKIK